MNSCLLLGMDRLLLEMGHLMYQCDKISETDSLYLLLQMLWQ
jgi:hypothetical protein